MAAWVLPAAIAAGSIASSVIGNNAANKQSNNAMNAAAGMRQGAYNTLAGIDPLNLPDFNYTPEMLQYIQGAAPAPYSQPQDFNAQDVQIDPATRQAQQSALNDMMQRSEEGLSAQDQYNFMKNRKNVETAARGSEQAIIEDFKRRGMGGTGIELAGRQMAQQGATDRLSESQTAQSVANANAKQSALNDYFNMASGLRGQDFSQEKTNADILNSFGWDNSERNIRIKNMNTDLKNKAAQANVDEQRGLQASNVSARNSANVMNQQQAIEKARAEQLNQQGITQSMANAQLGGMNDIYAAGAANANSARAPWDAINQAGQSAGNIYMANQQMQSNERIANSNAAANQANNAALMSMFNNQNSQGSPSQSNPYQDPSYRKPTLHPDGQYY